MTVLRSERVEGEELAPGDGAAGGLDDGWRRLWVGDAPRGEVEWRVDREGRPEPGDWCGSFRGTYVQAQDALNRSGRHALLWRPVADDGAAAPEAPLSMLAGCEALLAECLALTGRIVAWTAVMDGRGTGSSEVSRQDGRAGRLRLNLVVLRGRLRDVADRLDRL